MGDFKYVMEDELNGTFLQVSDTEAEIYEGDGSVNIVNMEIQVIGKDAREIGRIVLMNAISLSPGDFAWVEGPNK